MRYVDQHKPVLKGYGWDVLPVDLAYVAALRALRDNDDAALRPDKLLRLHCIWLDDLGVTYENRQLDPALQQELLFEVIETDFDDFDFQWEIHLDDALAGMHDDGLDELTAQLGGVDGVEEVHHEDREVWLVRGTPRRHDLERVVQT